MILCRRATSADAATCAKLWHASWHHAHGLIADSSTVSQRTVPSFQRRVQEILPYMLVATSEEMGSGNILGLAVPRNSVLEQLYIDPSRLGSGIGSALLQAAEDQLKRTAHGGIAEVIVAKRNLRAIRFYEKHGWSKGAGGRAGSNTVTALGTSSTLNAALRERVVAEKRQRGGMICSLFSKDLRMDMRASNSSTC